MVEQIKSNDNKNCILVLHDLKHSHGNLFKLFNLKHLNSIQKDKLNEIIAKQQQQTNKQKRTNTKIKTRIESNFTISL